MSRADAIVQQIVTGVLAVILIGGSVLGWLLGHEIPVWLGTADGIIITAAFANGAFFAQARTAQPTATALATAMEMHHELAVVGTQMLSPSKTTGDVSTVEVKTGT